MKNKSLVLSTGLAMFSMFFGSGNLVFPLVVGQMSQGHYMMAALGILLTGVLVPFLGILAMLLYKGDSNDFFSRLGKWAPFTFSLFCLSIMGPLGVLARCITVAHGAFKLMLPSTPLWCFSVGSCILILLLTIRKNRIVPILGSLLTPILLVSLGAIAVMGLISADFSSEIATNGAWDSFKTGVFQGYQTMDLLAAFFFSTFVIQHLNAIKTSDPRTILPTFIKSSAIGAGLLSVIYLVLVILASANAQELAMVPPTEMLGFVAQKALGKWAAPIVCSAVVLACLTTGIVLASLFADFLKKEVTKDKIPMSLALVTTLGLTFFTSTLEFSGIAKFIGPLLELIYPALIVLTVLNISFKLWGWKTVRLPIAAAFLMKLFIRL